MLGRGGERGGMDETLYFSRRVGRHNIEEGREDSWAETYPTDLFGPVLLRHVTGQI